MLNGDEPLRAIQPPFLNQPRFHQIQRELACLLRREVQVAIEIAQCSAVRAFQPIIEFGIAAGITKRAQSIAVLPALIDQIDGDRLIGCRGGTFDIVRLSSASSSSQQWVSESKSSAIIRVSFWGENTRITLSNSNTTRLQRFTLLTRPYNERGLQHICSVSALCHSLYPSLHHRRLLNDTIASTARHQSRTSTADSRCLSQADYGLHHFRHHHFMSRGERGIRAAGLALYCRCPSAVCRCCRAGSRRSSRYRPRAPFASVQFGCPLRSSCYWVGNRP